VLIATTNGWLFYRLLNKGLSPFRERGYNYELLGHGQIRAFNIFQVYQYFTIYRQYFLLKFEEFS
jgi:hypothetical protein